MIQPPKTIICKDKDGNSFEIEPSELSFRHSVYGVIIENGKILLSKQWDGYDFPGGGIELGETIEEALKREVKEETGLEVAMGKIISCENSFYKPKFHSEYWHAILMYYVCTITGGQISIDGLDDHEKQYVNKPEWIDLEAIESIKFYTSVDSIKIIKEARETLT